MAGTNLTADANFVEKGEYRLQIYPLAVAVTPYVGGYVYLDGSGNLNPIPANNGSTDNSALRCCGQVTAANTAILTSEGKAVVRFDGIFEVNILAGQTLVAGTLVYFTSDNQVTNTSSLNPKAGIFIELSPAGNAMIKSSLTLPS